jgi:nicotinamidase/pyrazinamidase
VAIRPQIDANTALLVIDLQNDFCPGGALAVAEGDAIIPLINALAARLPHTILTQDWHPERHISFATTHPGREPYEAIQAPYGPQALWPDHCLQHSPGADFHVALDVPRTELILRKGFRPHIDSYSAFLENDHTTPTGLGGYLRERGITRLYLCGLAYDFCVRFSALDGKALGFETIVIEDATRAVDLPASGDQPGSVAATNAALDAAQIPRIHSSQILQA